MRTITVRIPMPPSKRAKQFMMFDALHGLKEAIAAKEKIKIPRKELSEDMIAELNKTLIELHKGQLVTVVYYDSNEENYLQFTGPVVKVDSIWSMLQVGNISIEFEEITELIPESA